MRNNFSRGYFNFPSKREGGIHWLLQRGTGVLLIFLSGWFLVNLLTAIPSDYEVALAWVRTPLNAILFASFIGMLLYHAYLGIEVIIDDYVHMAFWYSVATFLLKAAMILSVGILGLSFYRIIF